MTWRLRDQKLQRALDEATGGDFSKRLNDAVISGAMEFSFVFGESKFTMSLIEDEIEDIPEYNPHEWNEFPKVTPPENVWMRLEIFRVAHGSQYTFREAAFFRNGKWHGWGEFFEFNDDDDVYFRSWED